MLAIHGKEEARWTAGDVQVMVSWFKRPGDSKMPSTKELRNDMSKQRTGAKMTVLTLDKGKLRSLMMLAMSRMWAMEWAMEVNDLNMMMSVLCCEQARCACVDVVVELVEFCMCFFVHDAQFNIIYLYI